MISVTEAQRVIQSQIPAPMNEAIKIGESNDRIVAMNLQALFPMPAFDNSAMDGFAVRAQDTTGAKAEKPVVLKVKAVVAAGFEDRVVIESGQCTQVMTGAPIPEGANAVLMVEHTSGFTTGSTVEIFREARVGEHIRHTGEEIETGALLIPRGTRITPAETGVLASFGFKELLVYHQPSVAVLATGDELVHAGETLGPHQIFNSNLPTISALIEKAGARIVARDTVRDDEGELREAITNALKSCDVLVTTGGVSMGRFDYLRHVLESLGVKEHFWKVAQKPGKPLYFGTLRKKLVFGLPGNPVSAFIGFMVWIWPVLEKMQGKEPNSFVEVILNKPFPRDNTKHRFLFGKMHVDGEKLVCQPAEKVGSHMLTSSLNANCILMAGPGKGLLPVGEKIKAFLLPWKMLD